MFDMNDIKRNVGKLTKNQEDEAAPRETVAPISHATTTSRSMETATIGPSIQIKGDLTGEEDLTIQGTVEGTINLKKNNITIGINGRIHANVYAKTINVEGELEGDLFGDEKVIIRKTGNVKGNIVAPRVNLEDGAMFKGSIEMEPSNKSVIKDASTKPTDHSNNNAQDKSKKDFKSA